MMLALPHAAALSLLMALMMMVAVIDIRSMIIPDWVNAAIFVSGLLASLIVDAVNPLSALAASGIAAALLALVQMAFRAVRGYDGLGWGDVKFIGAAATWTGLEGLAFALLVASILALFFVLSSQALTRKFDYRQRIPFGPFLALGATSVAGFQLLSGISMLDVMDMWLIGLLPSQA
jgi:leader peptidase (prepilin peptidase) / N-methyltransferase